MTTPHLPAQRPLPDAVDLRLLAELINNAYIPLANAAFNTGMSQTEAALRLVSMAERGLPLRLVADGDRQALWQIAQAGPVSVPAAAPGTPPAAVAGASASPEPAPAPAPPARWAEQPVTGPAGEHLAVTILEVFDPADAALAEAGHPVPAGQRAVLVHSTVTNHGAASYPAPGDLNLVLQTDQGFLLGRSGLALPSYPVFPSGIEAGRAVDGWSVFLIDADVALAGIKWCIRPDVPETILGWPIKP